MHFYALIIGTEILNGRREDKHFDFLKKELQKYSHELFASFILKDDTKLIAETFRLIQKDPDSVIFSFGGIGSTPDDLTRAIAAEVFTSKPLVQHPKFSQDIVEKFGKEAYPHRIHMADLPEGAELIQNPVNNMSGFSLEKRFFFVPGFPSMAHPMLTEVIQTHFCTSVPKYRYTLLAQTSENTLISLMQKIPDSIELSSLPIFKENKPQVELSLSGENDKEVSLHFKLFIEQLKQLNIEYKLI